MDIKHKRNSSESAKTPNLSKPADIAALKLSREMGYASIKDALDDGNSQREIAQALGVDHSSVARRLGANARSAQTHQTPSNPARNLGAKIQTGKMHQTSQA